MARARGVGVGELVDQANGRPARQDRVDVHLAERDAAVFDDARRDDLELADLLLGLDAAMRFDEADDHVDSLGLQPVSFAEHRVGLAHAGRRAHVDLEPAARLSADQVQELLGTGSLQLRTRHGRLFLTELRPAACRVRGSRVTHSLAAGRRLAIQTGSSRDQSDYGPPGRTEPWPRRRVEPGSCAASGLMSGSSPEPEAVTRSTGAGSSVVALSAATRAAIAFRKSGLFVPRFDPLAASAL